MHNYEDTDDKLYVYKGQVVEIIPLEQILNSDNVERTDKNMVLVFNLSLDSSVDIVPLNQLIPLPEFAKVLYK